MWWHPTEDEMHFEERRRLERLEWEAPCGFCVLGVCQYGDGCSRRIRSQMRCVAAVSDYDSSSESEEPEVWTAEERSEAGSEDELRVEDDWDGEVVPGTLGSADEGRWLEEVGCGGRYSALGVSSDEECDEIDGRLDEAEPGCDVRGGGSHNTISGSCTTDQKGLNPKARTWEEEVEDSILHWQEEQGYCRGAQDSKTKEDEEEEVELEITKEQGVKLKEWERQREKKMWEKDPIDWREREWARLDALRGVLGLLHYYRADPTWLGWWESGGKVRLLLHRWRAEARNEMRMRAAVTEWTGCMCGGLVGWGKCCCGELCGFSKMVMLTAVNEWQLKMDVECVQRHALRLREDCPNRARQMRRYRGVLYKRLGEEKIERYWALGRMMLAVRAVRSWRRNSVGKGLLERVRRAVARMSPGEGTAGDQSSVLASPALSSGGEQTGGDDRTGEQTRGRGGEGAYRHRDN